MRITVNVPATTANLGPGFDCLGLALDVWNTIQVQPSRQTRVQLRGETEGLPADSSNAAIQAMRMVYDRFGKTLPPLRVTMTNRIPIGRGLGSSAAALIGGLVAANALIGEPFNQNEILALAMAEEGHLDNISAALYGGMTISVVEGDEIMSVRLEPPEDWRAVLFVPRGTLSTQYARTVLPKRVSRADAVFNIGRAALIAYAFAQGDPAPLTLATQDRLHQPYREKLIPGMPEMLDAVRAAGATGAALSGAGPGLVAFAPNAARAARLRDAFDKGARELNVQGAARIIKLSARGAYIKRT